MRGFVREVPEDLFQALAERLPQPRNHKPPAIVAVSDDTYDAI
jgi:hypothetical protein